jgi:hypothetical protein
VWAQWRYENDLPDAAPPRWLSRPIADRSAPARRDRQADELLLFTGGGKDSLVSMRLLEGTALPFATYAYASSEYGRAAPQLALLDALAERGTGRRRERQLVLDDFPDAPVLELYGEGLGVRTRTAAETPSSIFGALPLLLDLG